MSEGFIEGQRRANFRATVALGAAMAAGTVGIGAVYAQEASPSFDPNASATPGLIAGEPCATPAPSGEPQKTEPPFPTIDPNIGRVPGGELALAQGATSDGKIVTISEQAAPSASVEPIDIFASPSPSAGPRTAINCASPRPELSPKPTESAVIHTAQELFELDSKTGVTTKKLKLLINKAYAQNQNPEVTEIIMPKVSEDERRHTASRSLEICDSAARDNTEECAILIESSLYIHMITKDPNFWKLAVGARDFSVSKHGEDFEKRLYRYLADEFPEGYIPHIDEF